MQHTSRTRSPAVADSASEAKKQRPSEPPPLEDSDDEKSDQDLVVDEVTEVSGAVPPACT